MKRLSALFLIALFAFAAFAGEESTSTSGAPSIPAKRYGTWGIDLDGMDRTVKPGDDFFRFVNGKWAATTQIPLDKTSFGAFGMLSVLSEARVRAILDRLAADGKLKAGSNAAKVAAIYRTFLDDATAEKLDARPLQPYIETIKKAETHDDIARLMGRSTAGLGRSFVSVFVSDDAKNPEKYA